MPLLCRFAGPAPGLALVFSVGILGSGSAMAQDFVPVAVMSGVARAVDGDDIAFGQVRVRLRGIAAPEDRTGLREPGGPEATANLAALVDGRIVECFLDGTTAGSTYRPVARCFVDGVDIGEQQVRAGMARDCPAFSGGAYRQAEVHARRSVNLSEIYELPGYCTTQR